MSDYKVSGASLTSVANAIRTKGGTSADLSFPDGFVTAVGNIPTSVTVLVSKSITENGTYDPANDNADGYSSVSVSVPQSSSIFEKVGTYTLAEEWGSGSTGQTACETLLANYYNANAMNYVMVFKNNTSTSSYAVDEIVIGKAASSSDLSSIPCFIYRNGFAGFATGLSAGIRASAGTVVDIYRALHT